MSDRTTISLEIDIENLTDKERAMLTNIFKKANSKSDERYPKPKDGQVYWYINELGEVDATIWKNDRYDNAKYEMHNCYLSLEAADFEAERLKVIAELKNFSFEPDWESFSQKKYFFYYDYKSKVFIKTYNTYTRDVEVVYFKSENLLNQAIEAVGEDRILKYIFEVE